MHAVTADFQVVLWIPSQELHVFGRGGYDILDHGPGKTQAPVLVHETTALQRPLLDNGYWVTHADVFEHIQYGPVNLLLIRFGQWTVSPARQARSDRGSNRRVLLAGFSSSTH
jgi:hypothetical protein